MRTLVGTPDPDSGDSEPNIGYLISLTGNSTGSTVTTTSTISGSYLDSGSTSGTYVTPQNFGGSNGSFTTTVTNCVFWNPAD